MKILSFGEIIWDVFPDDKYIGGATFNFAANLALFGADSYLLSSVGNDTLADEALTYVDKFKIKNDFISRCNDKETGQCIVHFDKVIGPYYTIKEDVSYDYLCFKERLIKEDFDALSFGSLALRSKNNFNLLDKLINSNKYKLLFCDINLRAPFYNEKVVNYCFDKANILKINDLEFNELINKDNKDNKDFKEVLKEFTNNHSNIKIVLLTCGEKGAYAYVKNQDKLYYQQAMKVDVVSTVGAGDSFGACFLYHYINDESIEDCLLKATIRSAKIVSQMSAI